MPALAMQGSHSSSCPSQHFIVLWPRHKCTSHVHDTRAGPRKRRVRNLRILKLHGSMYPTGACTCGHRWSSAGTPSGAVRLAWLRPQRHRARGSRSLSLYRQTVSRTRSGLILMPPLFPNGTARAGPNYCLMLAHECLDLANSLSKELDTVVRDKL
jgi:hypothetical protein